MIEVNVWNMDHLSNKHIKITRDAVTGRNILTITDKEVMSALKRRSIKSSLGNKKFYSTLNSIKNDKYLGYITPLKPEKDPNFPNLNINKPTTPKTFSAMDIETLGVNPCQGTGGKEIPIAISIRSSVNPCQGTGSRTKIFLIDHNLLINDLNLAINNVGFFF
jgi:hypothetical protein